MAGPTQREDAVGQMADFIGGCDYTTAAKAASRFGQRMAQDKAFGRQFRAIEDELSTSRSDPECLLLADWFKNELVQVTGLGSSGSRHSLEWITVSIYETS
jgi:hypothetical protein